MKQKNRLYGMIVCLSIIILSFVIGSYYPSLKATAYLLLMFCAGYAFRETLERNNKEGKQNER